VHLEGPSDLIRLEATRRVVQSVANTNSWAVYFFVSLCEPQKCSTSNISLVSMTGCRVASGLPSGLTTV